MVDPAHHGSRLLTNDVGVVPCACGLPSRVVGARVEYGDDRTVVAELRACFACGREHEREVLRSSRLLDRALVRCQPSEAGREAVRRTVEERSAVVGLVHWLAEELARATKRIERIEEEEACDG